MVPPAAVHGPSLQAALGFPPGPVAPDEEWVRQGWSRAPTPAEIRESQNLMLIAREAFHAVPEAPPPAPATRRGGWFNKCQRLAEAILDGEWDRAHNMASEYYAGE